MSNDYQQGRSDLQAENDATALDITHEGLKRPMLIGLGGKLRAGKDTVADYLAAEYGFVKLGMSDALSEALYALNPIVEADGHSYARYQQLVDAQGYTAVKKIPEVRRLLQALGTEVGRNIIGQQTWTAIVERRIRDHWGNGQQVVVTGIRFPNELTMIQSLGGVSVYVDRPTWEAATTQPTERVVAAIDQALHASETSVDPSQFDIILSNDAGLVDLWKSADNLLMMLKHMKREALKSDHPERLWPPYDH